MSSVINTNVKALTAQGSLNSVNNKMSQAMQRLSTGLRINSAKDDAAGLAITNKMTADIRGLSVAIRNANDGLSLAQTAEGAMSSIGGMLQRMRELAVQSANGSSSDLARKSSQLEINQLKEEINNIAAQTSINGIKLLDGSASKLILQTGSEIGQTMNLQLESVNTSSLGVGSRPSLSATGAADSTAINPGIPGAAGVGTIDSRANLRTGDLYVNGISVAGSIATDDQLSYAGKIASSIAKAAAINRISTQTGVKAVVNETYVAGAAMTAVQTNGSITLNGVTTASFTTSGDAGVSRNVVVNAINAIANQTGVTAVDSGDDKNGVILKAKDGRNVTVSFTNLDAAKTGVTLGTTTGSYSLQSISGDPIILSASSTGDITRSGLSAGSYSPNASAMTTSGRTPSNAAPSLFSAGTLKINGVAISGTDPSNDTASDTTATSSTRSGSAISIAAAINKSKDLTGVTAVVNANTVVGDTFTAANISGETFSINGVSIDITSLNTTSWTRADLADLINRNSGRTGVVASDNGRGLTYTATDGRNISLGTTIVAGSEAGLGLAANSTSIGAGLAAGAAVSGSAVTTYAKISLVSDKQFSMTSGAEGSSIFDAMGFKQGTFGGESNGFKVSQVDVSSQNGATAALKAIDAALDSVNFSQSRLGALQNRLDTVISNLTEVSRNTSESRSRIMDADYASETTSLAKSQIVQQAATAMLAQANQSAQSVLSLLK